MLECSVPIAWATLSVLIGIAGVLGGAAALFGKWAINELFNGFHVKEE